MNNEKFLKASIWYFASTAFLKGIGLITTPFFARILSENDYGLIENFNAILSIFLIVSSLCLSATLISARFDFQQNVISYIKTCLIFDSSFVLLVFFAFLLFKKSITMFFNIDDSLFYILFAMALFNPAYEMFIFHNQLLFNYKIISIINLFTGLFGVIGSFVLIKYLENDVYARLIGMHFPVLFSSIVFYAHFIYKGNKFDLGYIKYALPLCIPFVVHSISGAILNSSDRIMITKMCGAYSNAFYSLACSCGQLAFILWLAMNTAFVPWLSNKLNEEKYEDVLRFSKYYILTYMIIIFGVLLIVPEFLYVLGGSGYQTAMYSVPSIVVGFVFLFLYSMYVNIEQFKKNTRGMAIATTFCALLNILLNYYLIPVFGYIAAAYTTMLGYLFMLIFHCLLVKKMKMHRVYNTGMILFFTFFYFLMSFVFPSIYNYLTIRLLILLIYSAVCLTLCIVKRKKIFYLIKTLIV